MKTIVITGSTRGIGLALAREFLKHNCSVVISGRSQAAVDRSLESLSAGNPAASLAGFACDVSDYAQLQALWQQSAGRFGRIDIWINNAGVSNMLNPPWDVPPDEIKCVVETNVLGEMYGTRVAMNGFKEQGSGALYNMEGMGAKDGRKVKGLSIYGSTKAALGYFNDAIFKENTHPNILVGAIQPGMMLTNMVMCQYEDRPEEWAMVKDVLTILSEDVDVVAAWLAKKILANNKNGMRFTYGGMFKILPRVLRHKFSRRKPPSSK